MFPLPWLFIPWLKSESPAERKRICDVLKIKLFAGQWWSTWEAEAGGDGGEALDPKLLECYTMGLTYRLGDTVN